MSTTNWLGFYATFVLKLLSCKITFWFTVSIIFDWPGLPYKQWINNQPIVSVDRLFGDCVSRKSSFTPTFTCIPIASPVTASPAGHMYYSTLLYQLICTVRQVQPMRTEVGARFCDSQSQPGSSLSQPITSHQARSWLIQNLVEFSHSWRIKTHVRSDTML